MTAHDWFIEHRTDFAARTLDPDDETTFRAHLERCDECRQEVEAIERELDWLPMGVTPVTPRPGLKRRIVEGTGLPGPPPQRLPHLCSFWLQAGTPEAGRSAPSRISWPRRSGGW
jgi:anti-sigma factor RsiW